MDSLAVRTASPAPSTSSSSVAAAGHQNGVNGINGNAINGSIVNGKARQRDAFPGVSFGPGVRVPLPPHSQQVAGSATTSYADDPNLNFNSRFNTLAMQDDAIVAAGPSTPSTSTASAGVSRYQTPPPPQPVAAAATAPAAESSDTDLLEHIYQKGFIGGEFGDINLHYRPDRQPLKLHSLIVSRSPTIAALLQHPHSHQQPADIFLPLNGYEQVTDDALVLAIGSLYSSKSRNLVTGSNAPSVLLAATLLQLSDLAEYAFSLCKEAIEDLSSVGNVRSWLSFISGLSGGVGGKSNNTYEQQLSEAIFERLAGTLPRSLNAFNSQSAPQQQAESQGTLQHIYAALPFELLKAILESPELGSGEGNYLSDQTRFNLAKKCIAERKKLASVAGTTAPSDFEETVVLAFGGASAGASNVSVVRKPKQSRKLWKVNG